MPTKFVLRSDMCRIDSGELPGDSLHLFYEIRSDRKSVDIGDYFLERCGYRVYYLEEICMTRLLRFITLLILALTVRLVSAATGSADFAGPVDIGGDRKMYLECRGTGSPTVVLVAGLRPQPLIVLSADRPWGPQIPSMIAAGTLPADVPADFGYVTDKAQKQAQEQLAKLVSNAKHITNTKSGHDVHKEQPQLVIDSIRKVVDAVHDPASWP
jgi:hypothetical protein